MDRPDVRYARAADGACIAYQAFGTGRYDIVFIPGQITHLDLSWDEPQEAAWLRRLASLGRVIVMDRRGVGLSDRLAPGEAPPAEVLVDDLGAVMEAAGATHPILFGTAVGGQLASLYAASHPDRIRGLVTYAMWSHVEDGQDREEWHRYISWTLEHFGSTESALNDAREVWPSRADDADFVSWVGRVLRGAMSPGSFRPLMEAGLALDIRTVLATITVPTLAMYRPNDSSERGQVLRSSAERIPGASIVELPGTDHWWSAAPAAPMFEALEAFIAGLGGARAATTRRLSTIVFTDIVGSTARAAELGDHAWRAVLEQHHAIVRRELERYSGTEVNTAGDGFLATFDGPARAVHCARAIGARVRDIGLEVRAGVHTGEIEAIDGNVGGIAVHVGARVAALAGPSEVLATSTVKDLTAGSGIVFEDAGVHTLKGVPDRWHVYRVGGEDMPQTRLATPR